MIINTYTTAGRAATIIRSLPDFGNQYTYDVALSVWKESTQTWYGIRTKTVRSLEDASSLFELGVEWCNR